MPARNSSARELGAITTLLCAAAALGSFGLATVATLTTDNELGTVAAFALGFVFSVTAILGRIPYLKFAGSELDPRIIAAAVVHEAEEAAETATEPEQVAQAARAALQEWKPLSSSERRSFAIPNDVLLQNWRTAMDRGRDHKTWSEEKQANDTDAAE